MTDFPEFAKVDEPDPAIQSSVDSARADSHEISAPQSLQPQDRGEGWSGTDIEEAYLKALEAMEGIPWEERPPAGEKGEVPDDLPDAVDDSAQQVAAAETEVGPASDPAATALSEHAQSPAPLEDGPRIAAGTERNPQTLAEESNVTPAQVIEAALFVGGAALPARKICALLRGGLDTASVERTIDELNSAYSAQGRPYEIRLGDGGYRLELRPEYDRLRHRVYGSGPREVRLSQDVLEVLALVAYRQPISQQEIEGHGKQNAGNLLRQLLRRDLVAFERGAGGRKDLQYHTTPRFLSVFGLGSLDELPQPEDLARK